MADGKNERMFELNMNQNQITQMKIQNGQEQTICDKYFIVWRQRVNNVLNMH